MNRTLLACSNLTAALFVQKCRAGWKKFDNALCWIEKKWEIKLQVGSSLLALKTTLATTSNKLSQCKAHEEK